LAPPAAAPPIARGLGPRALPLETVPLAIRSQPRGAEIVVDGEWVGVTPFTLRVTPGEHQITLTKTRYAQLTSAVRAPAEVDLNMHRPLAKLSITSTPPGSEVLIQGHPRGSTPLTVEVPEFQSYKIEVVRPGGGSPWRRTVYLKTPSTALQAFARPE
jgi:hypothetical protein